MLNVGKLLSQPKNFRRLTGLTPAHFNHLLRQVEPLWQAAETERLYRPKRIRKAGGGRKPDLTLAQTLFVLLVYYRSYASHSFLGLIATIDESTVGRYINRLEPLLSQVFRIPKQKVHLTEDDLFILLVDATEQETSRRRGTGFSGKKKRQTIKTQVHVTVEGKIKCVSGSISGNRHDKHLYDEAQVRILDPHGNLIRVLTKADLAYMGTAMSVPNKTPPNGTLTKAQEHENKLHAKIRWRVEHTIGQLKKWQILEHRYRNPISSYNLTFRNIAGLRNLITTPGF